jgi:hypothetical protein
VNLPAPIPLEPPPGDPSALADLVSAVTGAAFGAGVLSAHLAGPAASAPGWLSADATAAAEQVGTVAALVAHLHDALTVAEQRLRVHAAVLDDAGQRIAALRRDQAEDFAVAWTIVSQSDPDLARPVVEQFEAAEADRRRAHAAAVADVLDDAMATAQVLDGSTIQLGGTGAPGQDAAVLANMATLLPSWGDGELLAEAWAAARSVGQDSEAAFAAWLRSAGPLLDLPVFATAFVQALDEAGITRVLYWTATDQGSGVATGLARAMRAAAASSDAGRRAVSQVMDVALGRPEATTTVAVGRLAAAGAFDAGALRGLAARLVQAEAASPYLRRDQLSVAPGDDPLASVLGALAAAGDADAAALLVADPDVWPTLLGRVWTEGLDGLSGVLRLAAGGAVGEAATLVVLEAIARTGPVLLSELTTGSPEAFAVSALSTAVADLITARPEGVSGVVLGGLGAPGAPSRPLDDSARLAMVGIGLIGLERDARLGLLRWLTDATEQAPFPAPGEQDRAAYLEGGIFGALASGEAFESRRRLFSAVERQAADDLTWNLITAPLAFLPLRRVLATARDVVTTAGSFIGPDGVPWESFLGQPETGPDQATYAALVARVVPLVTSGVLPDPGIALDHGTGSPEARAYEASLSPEQHLTWNSVVLGAQDGFVDVGGQLGILPGA